MCSLTAVLNPRALRASIYHLLVAKVFQEEEREEREEADFARDTTEIVSCKLIPSGIWVGILVFLPG